MGDPTHPDQAQVLIDRISAEADAEISAILEAATRSAQAEVAAAHKTARARMHSAIAELRQAEDQQLVRTRAGLDTKMRQQAQSRDAEAVAAGLIQLVPALQTLWADAAQRQSWCDTALAAAIAQLPKGLWQVDLPADTPALLSGALATAIAGHCGTAPKVNISDDLTAGVRITSGPTRLDASATALAADTSRLSALLLGSLFTFESEQDT